MRDLFDEPKPMKAISLWQPWASLMAAGVKIHETRHWSTPHRGKIAIHAAKRLDHAAAPDQLCASVFGSFWARELPAGAIVAIGDLRRVALASEIEAKVTSADRTAGNFAVGRFAWEIANLQALRKPIPVIGRQGLFNWTPPADLEDHLKPPIDHLSFVREIGWA